MTFSEENYLKTIYHLTTASDAEVSTNAIAEKMETKASSVTDMLKKLAEKGLINYKKYQGVSLTQDGKLAAKMIVRKHRLWEVFLVEKLGFSWDEVHDIAEQLEHIKSEKLINKLDDFLDNPTEDPHGDPIPDREGRIIKIEKQLLSELSENQSGICVGVKDTSSEFLKYLDKQEIALGSKIEFLSRESFDLSLRIKVNGKELTISNKIASNLFVKLL
ncbi:MULTISPECIES: metal-dependent transcriptional regulator [Flavobacterium]|jgi:DtxR family Mn-dependent transcriptional regulator|uniref:Transcriptional regulator MntR n=1 Tax=Flavobacterium lindanitolerans TaxID=428988 RepID=A0A497V8V6_9FLAO|nr:MULTISPECIES: metal-dependent transcriptional regulator [Flavobacterium]MBU7569650.1 metal-dependent transcriptional regulator [Flavobacterium sp.]PZO30024.1 MAG: metal-dependent transcriptional regulator [Flavobacteriaceae bacterium]THD32712.1 MAG: metal-dependent transcriptional regulator [Flavobacterium johnsoniae]KQS52826.1 iron-dependent repressor [Flavobacterium sp. Leaf359]MBC8643504.1 metal-dependent transcriptional regulator [Flavobacterium lindanitolerans]